MSQPVPQDSPSQPQAAHGHRVLPVSAPQRPLMLGSHIFRRAAFGDNHPLKIVRHAAVLDLVRILGWLDDADFRDCPAATVDELATFHDRAYIEALQYADSTGRVDAGTRRRFGIGTLENPLFPGLFERAATTVGGSVLAARLAIAGRVVFHPSGGTHHGRPDRASGFCYFNDPVFAIRTLLGEGAGQVMYIDLDAHHGDGVEDAFAAEPRVMTVSIHERSRWPYSGAADDRRNGGARNLPVPKGFNDDELDYLLRHALLPLAEAFQPEAVVVCCGADALAGDPLSGMMLSNVALWRAVESLLLPGRPAVVLGGGGYNPWTVTRYWAGLWGRLAGRAFPEALPDAAVTLLRDMQCELIDEDQIDARWLTTLVDAPHAGPVRDEIKSLAATIMRAAPRGH
jgi:acetoin utilization protein AcuC